MRTHKPQWLIEQMRSGPCVIYNHSCTRIVRHGTRDNPAPSEVQPPRGPLDLATLGGHARTPRRERLPR